FESFVSAIIIMATVPLGLACDVFALILTGTSLNAYSQIGLVLLVGVMAKNGILVVEFANQLRDRGLGVREAIEQAANIRLRPVMMTMICTVLGGVPLVLASGAGAEARIALGWVIVGGLGLATLSTLFLTPVAYLLLGRFVTPKSHEQARLKRELEEASYANVEPAEYRLIHRLQMTWTGRHPMSAAALAPATPSRRPLIVNPISLETLLASVGKEVGLSPW